MNAAYESIAAEPIVSVRYEAPELGVKGAPFPRACNYCHKHPQFRGGCHWCGPRTRRWEWRNRPLAEVVKRRREQREWAAEIKRQRGEA